jgi:Tfp pilus assembly protein PilO
MPIIRISPREKILIAVGGGAFLVFVLMRSYAFPYWDSLAEGAARTDIYAKRLTSYRRILQGQNSVKAALEAAKQRTDTLESGLLESKTDALANAEIQGLVKDFVLSKGMDFRRADLMPVKAVSREYSKVSTRIELKGNLDQLVDFLVGCGTAPKILFVEEMRIAPVQLGNLKSKQISATLQISALKRQEPSSVTQGKKS